MHGGPFQHHGVGPRWEAACDQFLGPDVEFCPLALVFGMEMWWIVIQEVHPDDDPIEAAQFGHGERGYFNFPMMSCFVNIP